MKTRITALILAFTLLSTGCSKKDEVPATPQGPFDYDQLAQLNNADVVQFGTEYVTQTGKITFNGVYRCELLTAGSKEYRNAVVVEIEANSMENAQETLKGISLGRLYNQDNAVYQIPEGYTLARDPVTNELRVIFQTKATKFDPDFRFFQIGDFSPVGQSNLRPILFDTGELLAEADITPFRPQPIPATFSIEEANTLLAEALNNSDFDARIEIEDEKINVVGSTAYRGSNTAALNDGRDLYMAARKALARYSLRMDSFDLTLTDASGVPAYRIDNLEYWKKPDAFYLENYNDKNDVQQIDLLEGAAGVGSAYITLEKYNKINVGDSLSEVRKIIGSPGECLSSIDVAGIKTEMYAWYGEDGFSCATILFQDDQAATIAQFGL